MPYHSRPSCIEDSLADLELLDSLIAPDLPDAADLQKKHGYKRRDADLDPLLLGAAAAYGHVTRNHYAHDLFPGVGDPRSEGAYDWTKWQPESAAARSERRPRLKYVSRQGPRSQKAQTEAGRTATEPLRCADNLPLPVPKSPVASTSNAAPSHLPPTPALEVKCMARTRVPTPHGPIFLHLYHNNRDNKEHLAIVVDPAQLQDETPIVPPIRSRTLDAIWSDSETEMDRITRGAYVGRLSASSQRPSRPLAGNTPAQSNTIPSPLIRIHSECFTGETIGSMRCDCGEQLDEAIRQLAQPIALPSPEDPARTISIPGRGAVIYMRQEGRGIGLLSKIRAYNLQDLGHDTVTANLMLGHGADERGYAIAGAILRDLGLGADGSEGVRILTNNPDKMRALEGEGIRIVERVPMVPRSWQRRQQHKLGDLAASHGDEGERGMGATMIGAGEVYGEDLDKYLRTKVLRMGHMLPLLSDTADV
ncbi:GTP cyclohydrolase II-domain-containing protein [Epithele typhae]|uniref:GTP cyclohydrolase II-domain-containing protein n=1 Tax=Epithele typhae TaxID=378194 RepID=UPI002008421B|nr:GTP cyclohydrolase II-domain-containing protein [Epithele typhae]KAH9943263.1 GTP cyclohydrolase II-domain-containing protein [Epithele typhae]